MTTAMDSSWPNYWPFQYMKVMMLRMTTETHQMDKKEVIRFLVTRRDTRRAKQIEIRIPE